MKTIFRGLVIAPQILCLCVAVVVSTPAAGQERAFEHPNREILKREFPNPRSQQRAGPYRVLPNEPTAKQDGPHVNLHQRTLADSANKRLIEQMKEEGTFGEWGHWLAEKLREQMKEDWFEDDCERNFKEDGWSAVESCEERIRFLREIEEKRELQETSKIH